MEAQFGLICAHLGVAKSIPLSVEEFGAVARSRLVLSVGLAVEEKFDIARENHAELEHQLLGMALENSLFRGRADELVSHARRSTSRRLTNYLATARLYVDQVLHDVARALDDPLASERIRRAIAAQYDGRLGYRAMEALRNHAQHRGLAVTAISLSTAREERFKPERLRFSVVPSLGIPELGQDGKFKAAILAELQSRADPTGLVALMPLVREHSESLGLIHTEVRSLLATPLQEAEQLFQQLQDRARNELGGDVRLLSTVRYDEDGTYERPAPIGLERSERRKELEKRNSDVGDVVSRFVSSE